MCMLGWMSLKASQNNRQKAFRTFSNAKLNFI